MPPVVFFNFHTNNYQSLVKINSDIKNIFKKEIYLNEIKYNLQDIIFMPTDNHFNAEIFKLDIEKGSLEKTKITFMMI